MDGSRNGRKYGGMGMERISFNENWKVWKDLDPFELVFHVPEDVLKRRKQVIKNLYVQRSLL